MPADRRAYLFVILLRDRDDAVGLARLLGDLRSPASETRADFAVPPVTGLRFFADPAVQTELDAWWAQTIRPEHVPVYLVDHEPGLGEWLPGVDGHVYVRVPAADTATLYPPEVTTFAGDHPLDYAWLVMQDHSHGSADLFSAWEATELAQVVMDLPSTARWKVAPPGRHDGPDAPQPSPVTDSLATLQPVTLASVRQPHLVPSPARETRWRSSLRRITAGTAGLSLRRSPGALASQRLAKAMAQGGPTIVVMGSRKGGVGKTSYAAGVAIQAGQLLDMVGHTACLVDANIANPDAWGHLDLPVRAATVRQAVAALSSNQAVPPPVHAQTPALACYPESREASDYTKTDVDRFAGFLRRRYAFIVVDMSNRLPDPLGGPEAAAAAYWLDHADVLVLPTTSAIADFNGVLDYLEVGGLPPVVVPYIVPRVRLNREHPVTRSYLEAIRARVEQVVEIPDLADKVRLAGMERVPVEQVSPALRGAYRRVTEAVLACRAGTPVR